MSDGTITFSGVSTPSDLPAADKLKIYKISGSDRLVAIDSGGNIFDLTPETLNKYDATAAPGTGDDAADGYSVGSVWIDVTLDDAYICLDSTTSAAVWKKTTP